MHCIMRSYFWKIYLAELFTIIIQIIIVIYSKSILEYFEKIIWSYVKWK